MSKTVKQLTLTSTAKTYDLIHTVDIDNDQDKKMTHAGFHSSKPYAELYVNGNATQTSIAVASANVNWTNNGATSTVGSTNKFTHDSANGRLTYTGEEDIVVMVHASISMARVSAGTNQGSASFYLSGAQQTKSEIHWMVEQTTGGRTNGVLTCILTLSKNDYIDLFVANETDTDNQIVSYLNMNITTL